MTKKTSDPKTKRLPKGQRKHIRRLKQEARKARATPILLKPNENGR